MADPKTGTMRPVTTLAEALKLKSKLPLACEQVPGDIMYARPLGPYQMEFLNVLNWERYTMIYLQIAMILRFLQIGVT